MKAIPCRLAPKRPDFTPAAFARHFGRVMHAAGFNGKDNANAEAGQKFRPEVQEYTRQTARLVK